MAAAAIPAISMGAQYFLNRGSNKRTQQSLNTASQGLQSSATDLSGMGKQLGQQAGGFLGDAQKGFGRANTALDQTQNYFSPLLSGSRGQIDAALAPDRAAVTDTYRGAEKALESSGMRGGVRDLASAELNRDRAGKLALLPSMARRDAAGGMLSLGQARTGVAGTQAGAGTSLTGQAVAAQGGATNAYSTLFGGANQQQAISRAYDNDSGKAIGSMIFDAVKSRKPKAGGGGAGGAGATPSFGFGAPNTGAWSFTP